MEEKLLKVMDFIELGYARDFAVFKSNIYLQHVYLPMMDF